MLSKRLENCFTLTFYGLIFVIAVTMLEIKKKKSEGHSDFSFQIFLFLNPDFKPTSMVDARSP